MSQVTIRKIVEGSAHVVISVQLVSNGVDGELSNYVIFSPSDCNPPLVAKPAFRIMQLWYGAAWFDMVLSFGGLVPRPAWTIARDGDSHLDFRNFGGLIDYNEVPPPDYNGDLLLSTSGFAPIGSEGSLVIELRKLGQ